MSTEFIKKQWNAFDIPTHDDFNRIEQGITNAIDKTDEIKNEIVNYNSKLAEDYNALSVDMDAKKTEFDEIKTTCNQKIQSVYEAFDAERENILSKVNKFYDLVRGEARTFNRTVAAMFKCLGDTTKTYKGNYTKTNNSNCFASWATSGTLSYQRNGLYFYFDANITGTVPMENTDILVARIPMFVAPKSTVELSCNINAITAKLYPDGVIIVNRGNNTNAITNLILTYRSSNSDWVYTPDQVISLW